jgi:hypothetical protein
MKRGLIFILIPVFLLSGRIFALDLRVSGGAGNIAFEDERRSSLGHGGLGFTPVLYPLGQVMIRGNYSRAVGFNAGFERDAILRNRFFTNIAFRLGIINFEIGPFAGVFNSREKPIKPGISTVLGVEIPGILFLSVHGASTLGSSLRISGDYVQETASAALGFWVPHVECIFGVHAKGFTRQWDQDLLTRDEQIRYQFRGNIFSRSVPYSLRLDLGYQRLKRAYIAPGVNQEDELDSLFIGFEVLYRIGSRFRLFLGGEMPVYSWGKKPLAGPDSRALLFQAQGGFTWTLPERP